MASSATGQDEPNPALWLATQEGKMEGYCPLGIAPSPSGSAKVFFRKILSLILGDFSVGMEQENQKTENAPSLLRSNWPPFQCLKINKYKIIFSVPYNPLLTKQIL